jgi:hypothetical protein
MGGHEPQARPTAFGRLPSAIAGGEIIRHACKRTRETLTRGPRMPVE